MTLPRLPIDDVLPDLLAAMRTASNIVLQAPTGAGKTTRVPPAILDANLTNDRIFLLEPRRLAARAAAARIAEERGVELGRLVGYHVRFEKRWHRDTRIIVITPGILLRMLHDDPFLEQVGVLLFDEFHERGLECDLALGLTRLIQQTVRPDLRIIAMSATLDTQRIADYLGGCPIIRSEGRLFPVEIRHEPKPTAQPLPEAVADAITRTMNTTPGDVLAFLPGMAEIRRTADALASSADTRDRLVLPLHGELPLDQQERALKPQPQRKIVLATNVAETSVTVEGVTIVIDSGLARVMMFDANVGLDRLELQEISRASAAQRAGRAGRLAPGVCVRLWSAENHRTRPEQTAPEIARIDLCAAALHLLALGESDVREFAWLDRPTPAALESAMWLLQRLDAIDEAGRITPVGQRMARLPVHPRLARMLLESLRWGHTDRVALACALLSERDPFLRDSGSSRGHSLSASDVLDRVHALEAFERHGIEQSPLGTMQRTAARQLLRIRDQLVRSLREEVDQPHDEGHDDGDDTVRRVLLAGFPDRVARRRTPGSRTGVMVGGRGVRLAASCGMADTEWFLCLDTDAGDREALVRQASAIERDWLPATRIQTRTEIEFDRTSEKLIARKRTRYEDVLLEDSPVPLPTGPALAEMLAQIAMQHLDRVLPDADTPAGNLLLRLACLREWCPELDLPAFEGESLRELLTWLTPGCRSFDDLRRADWMGALQGRLTREQWQTIEREAPERIGVPSGSRIALRYERGQPPVLAVRIQEVFGLEDTPRIALGRVKVLLHLLAPNYRPQQVTDDLASFWATTYPIVRKELRARYPKHAWPEDPTLADAASRPRRKKPDAT